MSQAIVSTITPTGPLVDPKTGMGTFAFTKYLQNIGQVINQAFDNNASLSPGSVPFPSATTLGGVLSVLPVAKKWISAITTGGVPQLSQPAFSDLSGSATAAQLPALSALSGSVTPAQVPQLSQIPGSVSASQVPPLPALSGQITEAQLPADGLSVTVVTAKLTPTGTEGSLTFTNGILTAEVAAT